MMVPVPTVPGHATNEWSNILPSILSGDSEASHQESMSVSQMDDDKNMPAKPTMYKPANTYDTYKPQPAIIVEMEPHVHESPSQIYSSSSYMDHHERPPQEKPDSEEDPSLDKVPLQTWSTSSRAPEFHYITTEILSTSKNQSEKMKATTPKPMAMSVNHRNKNATLEQTLTMYSELPMIPVSVITADQILTSTQKNKINERPVFEKLNTILPSTTASTAKPELAIDEKPYNVSIVSETHTTSVKFPGLPEIKVPIESVQTTMPVRTRPAMEEMKNTTRFTTPLATQPTTESILTTQYSTSESVPMTRFPQRGTTTVESVMSTTPMKEQFSTVTNYEVTETTIMNDVTTRDTVTKENTEASTVFMRDESTPTEKVMMFTVTERLVDKTTVPDVTKETTMFEPMTTTVPTLNKISESSELLSNDLANSLSSVMSQVAETIPSILGDTQNFPLSELKSKNISLSNEMFDSTTSKEMDDESSSIMIDDDSTEMTRIFLFEQSTTERNEFSTEVMDDATLPTTEKPNVPDGLGQTTVLPEEKSDPYVTSAPTTIKFSPTTMNANDVTVTNKPAEKRTEATVIHLDITPFTAGVTVPQTTTTDTNNESPLIRIQLDDIVSAVNHVIDNSHLKSEVPSDVHEMTLPPDSYTASPNIASGLIAGFLSNTMQQEMEINRNNYSTNGPYLDNWRIETQTETETPPPSTFPQTEIPTQRTTMENTMTTMDFTDSKVETTTNFMDSETTTRMVFLSTDKIDDTTVELMTTTEPEASTTMKPSSYPQQTRKPEIVRVDVSPESITSNLPPRIQLTDLPILQETTIPSKIVNKTRETAVNSNEKPSLQFNPNDKFGIVHTEKPTVTSVSSTVKSDELTQVPCTPGKKNCQITEDKKVTVAQIEQVKGQSAKIETTTHKMITSTSKNEMMEKKEVPPDFVKIQEPLLNNPINYIQVPLTNESKVTYEELRKPVVNKDVSNKQPPEPSTTTMKMKEEIKTTTPAPKITPSKQESYMKLGEQPLKEQINKTNGNSPKPQKPNKRPATTSTMKPTTKPMLLTTEAQRISKPPKTPSTTMQPTPSKMSEKKAEQTTKSSVSEEQKWSLISQQSTVAANKMKQDQLSSSTTTPIPETTEYPQRTASKPVNLEVVKNSAGLEDSVRHLDEDIQFFSNLCNELGFSFWTSANKGLSSSRSLALSPFGMTSMLAMIFLGARGPTSAQMNDILKLDDVATFNPHLVFQNITDAVSLARNQGIANAAFVRLLFADRIKVGKLMPFYKEQAQKFYEGFVAEVNFSTISDQVKRRTNLLVRKQTGGRIKDFVKTSAVPLRSPLAALSANVFQTNCNSSSASSEGRDGEMYFAVSPAVRQRRLVPVPATVWRSGVLAGYEPGLDATAIALGGTDKLVSTIFVIPGQPGFTAPGDTLDRLEQRLMKGAYRDKTWDKLLKVIVSRPALELQVPKFSHRSVVNATAALKRMGVEELFSRHANLKGIGFGHDIHLADVLQVIEIYSNVNCYFCSIESVLIPFVSF